jgi:hypothetical protein
MVPIEKVSCKSKYAYTKPEVNTRKSFGLIEVVEKTPAISVLTNSAWGQQIKIQ